MIVCSSSIVESPSSFISPALSSSFNTPARNDSNSCSVDFTCIREKAAGCGSVGPLLGDDGVDINHSSTVSAGKKFTVSACAGETVSSTAKPTLCCSSVVGNSFASVSLGAGVTGSFRSVIVTVDGLSDDASETSCGLLLKSIYMLKTKYACNSVT